MRQRERADVKKLGFCLSSRRWEITLVWGIPMTCPYFEKAIAGNCDDCAYFEWREPTAYVKRKMRIMESVMGRE